MTSAALLNANRLNFDGLLSFDSIAQEVELTVYAETSTSAQLIEHSGGCEILVSKEQPLGKEVLEKLGSVTLICEAGTGTDNIYPKATEEFGIAVRNVPHYSTNDVAQLAMTFIGVLAAGLHRTLRCAGVGDLASSRPWIQPRSTDLVGKVLGVVGAGAIGTRVIRLARAYDMEVRVFNPSPRDWSHDEHIESCSMREVLEQADYLTLHCPLNDDTKEMIGPEQLALMRQGSHLVNVSRGGLVDQSALLEALQANHIEGAALDVQKPEPPLPNDPLWLMDNVILTNHQGWKTIEARRRLIARVAEEIRSYCRRTEEDPTSVSDT